MPKTWRDEVLVVKFLVSEYVHIRLSEMLSDCTPAIDGSAYFLNPHQHLMVSSRLWFFTGLGLMKAGSRWCAVSWALSWPEVWGKPCLFLCYHTFSSHSWGFITQLTAFHRWANSLHLSRISHPRVSVRFWLWSLAVRRKLTLSISCCPSRLTGFESCQTVWQGRYHHNAALTGHLNLPVPVSLCKQHWWPPLCSQLFPSLGKFPGGGFQSERIQWSFFWTFGEAN